MLFNLSQFMTPLPHGVQVFASGVNRETEILGFSRLGIPVGVSVNHLSGSAIHALGELEQPVLVDSGAFGEVTFSPSGTSTKAEISDSEWRRRLAIYLHLASTLRRPPMLVVPDKVGDQNETLARLSRYQREIGNLAKTGARFLLPLQVGALSHREFFEKACKISSVRLTPAMPMRKAATSVSALIDFVREKRPEHVHLLGIGLGNRRTDSLIRSIRHLSPESTISMDSNVLRAVVGKNRPLSRIEAELRDTPPEQLWGEIESPVLALNGQILDYTDLIASPSCWASSAQLAEIAADLALTDTSHDHLLHSPDDFLQSPCGEFDGLAWIEHPRMAILLDLAWMQFVERKARSGVRSAAIACVFGDSRIRNQRAA